MITLLVSMITFAFVGAVTPGPVNLIATSSGASHGFLRTLPHVLGATLGYTLLVFIVGLGMNEVSTLIPQFAPLLRYAGGAFLLYLGYRIAMAPVSDNDADSQRQPPPRFHEGVLVQLLNPKAWLVSSSGIGLFVTSQTPAQFYLLLFCVVSFLMCFAGVGTWAAVGHLIRRYLTVARNQLIFNRIMGLLLSASVLTLFMGSS